jgi:uncharacterized protein (DUF1810 family)
VVQASGSAGNSKIRPLYDIPYMFEAREFLRKKLIGKRVNIVVDYVKPAQDQYPERICCTVTCEGMYDSLIFVSSLSFIFSSLSSTYIKMSQYLLGI